MAGLRMDEDESEYDSFHARKVSHLFPVNVCFVN